MHPNLRIFLTIAQLPLQEMTNESTVPQSNAPILHQPEPALISLSEVPANFQQTYDAAMNAPLPSVIPTPETAATTVSTTYPTKR